ncbi:MAG: ribonuclease [Clostridiales bacterium]|nr:ribonuclease [Candidatus Cacconaster stercorequi]
MLLALILALCLISCGATTSLPVVDDSESAEQESWEMVDSEDDHQTDAQQSDLQADQQDKGKTRQSQEKPDEGAYYYSKEDVALYIHVYGHLPRNFISKKEAQSKGWSGGSLEPYAPGCCIGGSHFGNYEGLLPEANGRSYTECDIGTKGKNSRGTKRIVFSNDGLIFYTGDHYKSFELLYGEVDG